MNIKERGAKTDPWGILCNNSGLFTKNFYFFSKVRLY